MILYRIIDETEYEACQNGEYDKLQKPPASEGFKTTNRMYKSDSDSNNTQYIYFFPYYEPWEIANGDYIMKVDIPEDLLEYGIGSYENPKGSYDRVLFVVLDEYRMKKEDFDPNKYVIQYHEFYERHESEWGKSEQFAERVEEACLKIIPLMPKASIDGEDRLDYSGIPLVDLDGNTILDLSVPAELQETLDKINRILEEYLQKKERVKIRRIEISDIKNPDYRDYEICSDIPSYMLKNLLRHYSVEHINQLFKYVKTPEQMKEIFSLLQSGYMYIDAEEAWIR